MLIASMKNRDATDLIGYAVSILVFSTFIFDYNEVGMKFDSIHIMMKLLVTVGIIASSSYKGVSKEAKVYLIMGFLYLHGFFSTIYVDSAYHQSFNQGMALLILLSQSKILKYYFHVVILGLFLASISLYYGAGFSYVKVLSGNPLSNYLQGAIFYALLSCYAYYFVVLKSSKKLIEIERLASIGLKSRFFMHEIKNLSKNGREQDNSKDILDCINLIVSGNIKKTNIRVINTINMIRQEFFNRTELEGIVVETSGDNTEFYSDDKSLEIILKNLYLNAIEHIEEFEQKKWINIETINNQIIIKNPCSVVYEGNHFEDVNFTTKNSHVNKGIGINIVKEMCQLNNIMYSFKVQNNVFISTISQ